MRTTSKKIVFNRSSGACSVCSAPRLVRLFSAARIADFLGGRLGWGGEGECQQANGPVMMMVYQKPNLSSAARVYFPLSARGCVVVVGEN